MSPGTLLSGRFNVEERIGVEGRFEVFRGIDAKTKRRVVVRMLDLDEQLDAQLHPDVESAAKALVALEHPSVVQILDAGGYRGRPYVITPAVESPTLERLLAAGASRSLPDALRLLASIGEALEHAHKLGLVHGDVSPSSIIVPLTGSAQIADIGLLHFVDLATAKARPLQAPAPLRLPSADIEALRRLSERLILQRSSLAPAPVAPSTASRPSMPATRAGSLTSMPALAPFGSATRSSVPAAPVAQAAPSAPPPLVPTVLMPAIQRSEVETADETVKMEIVPSLPVPAPAIIQREEAFETNRPSDTRVTSLLPKPGPAHAARAVSDFDQISDEALTPKYVVVARELLEKLKELLAQAQEKIAPAIERAKERSPHVERAAELFGRTRAEIGRRLPRKTATFRSFDESDSREASRTDLRGGWWSLSQKQRMIIAGGGAATLVLMLLVAAVPSSSSEASKHVIDSPAQAVGQQASSTPQLPEPAKKSNVERLRSRR
jgi:serine/threonine protein kinase